MYLSLQSMCNACWITLQGPFLLHAAKPAQLYPEVPSAHGIVSMPHTELISMPHAELMFMPHAELMFMHCSGAGHSVASESKHLSWFAGLEVGIETSCSAFLTCHCGVGGLNEYVWQAWAHLEAKQGNIGQARKVLLLSPASLLGCSN